MEILSEIIGQLLFEQEDKLEVLRKAILERLPISIYYSGPPDEVREGQRNDIEPIVMGDNKKSGNKVIWAYVFKGISKRGIPGWKMFRIDRIKSARYNNLGAKNFELENLPGYEKGKAPDAMRSLSSVDIYSPYWFEGEPQPAAPPVAPPLAPPLAPPAAPPVPQPIQKPDISSKAALGKIYNDLRPLIKDINGQKAISRQDYDNAVNNLYHSKEQEFKVYQRAIGSNERPGEGTRARFTNTSRSDIDKLLKKDNIQIIDNPEQLAEGRRIQLRIKRLINW
jgi:hypothetical protein